MNRLSHNKVVSKDTVVNLFQSGLSYMTGGFGPAGYPSMLYDWLYESDVANLTLITNGVNPPDYPYQVGFAKLVNEYRVKKLILTHCAPNPNIGRIMNEGRMEVEIIPQGTFAECIRAGGYGLGGVLTPTGIGTPMAEGKKILNINGKEYLLELPITADICLIRAEKCDTMGNCMFRNVSRSVNQVMPFACKTVIVEVPKGQIVEVGQMLDNEVMLPGVVVDYIVEVPEGRPMLP